MAESEKGRGKAVHEIILETERGTGSAQGQINRILEDQINMTEKQLRKSQMEQLLKESERKSKEEDLRMRKVEDDQKPLPTQPEEKTSEAKNILDAVRIGVEVAKPQQQSQGSMSEMAKSLAEMFKVGVEIGKGSQPQQPQQNSFEMMKQYHEMFLKPVLDQLNSKEKEMMTMRMNQIENKITAQVSPQEYIKQIKESANTLGLTGGGRTEVDLKLAEMGQTERFENRKLDLEEKKWAYEQENSGKTMEQVTNLIKTVGEGPIGKAIENMGSGVGERLKTGKANNSQQLVKIQCPNCYGNFSVNPALPKVVCVHCGAELLAKPPTTQPQEPQSQPEPPPVTQEPQQQQIDTPQSPESSQ